LDQRSKLVFDAGGTMIGARSTSGGGAMVMVLPAELLRSYVPGLLASRFVARPVPPDAPGVERLAAAVMFADISGFTPLAERLARRGPSGAEELSTLLNAYFAELTALLAGHGGEVITFAGDGLLAVWPATGDDAGLATATRDAGRCALAVQSALGSYQTVDGLRLFLRAGIGAGEVMALRVGGVGERWQLLLSGAPVVQCGLAEQQAARGEVVLSPEAWELARDACTGERLATGGVRLRTAAVPAGARATSPGAGARELSDEVVRAYVPDVVGARLAAGQAEWLAELRRVTAVFVNLLDVDPAAAGLLEPVQVAMAAIQPILQRYEGSLKQVVVDDKGLTLIAVFGLPLLAHEDDPARATRAALAVQAALGGLGLGCAIGLATGRAFCGAVGGDVHREYDVIGEVMNLAARLMQAAGDGILCDDATAQAARAHLRFQALPRIQVKGKADPVAVHRPLEPARELARPRAMLGRGNERTLLAGHLGALQDGTGGLVVIEGEPGIGKSRLLADLLEQARGHGLRTLVGAGVAIEKTTPYHAWRPVFAELMDLAGVEDVEERRRRVLAHVQADPGTARLAPLLSSVLPLELADNELTAQLTGEVRADNTRKLLVRLLQAAATGPGGTLPLLLVLDDAHWFDSASWALTRQVRAEVGPLLLVLATRPSIDPLADDDRRLRQDPATERVLLEPLRPDDTLALVCDRLGVRQFPEPVAALIQARAQGNPFFSEELAYALRDAGLIEIADGVCSVAPGAGTLSAVSLPETVQGVVAARIDRLGPGQELTLKVASVIGRLFGFRIIRDVHPVEVGGGELRGFLDDLARQEFTVLDAPEPDLAYLFKHVVTQEVAYSLLLYAQRRQLHRAVAEWYERSQTDLASLYPLLAYHWGRAEEPAKTLAYLELAGEQALRAGAYQEAVDVLSDAVALAGTSQPPPAALRRARWHRQLGDAYMGLGRLQESRQHADQAVALLGAPVPATPLRLVGDLGRQALRQSVHRIRPAWAGRGAAAARGAALEAARAFERLAFLNYYANARGPGISAVLHAVNLAERAGPSPELARAYASMSVGAGIVQLHALARSYAQKALEIARAEHDLPALAFVLVATSTYHGTVGNWATAEAGLLEGLEIAERLGDQRRWGELAAGTAVVLYFQGAFDRLADWEIEMDRRARNADDPQRKAHAILGKIWHLMPQGRTDLAVEELQEATRLLAGRGSRTDEIIIYGVLALAHWRRQEEEQARWAAQRAAGLIAQSRPTAAYMLEGYAGVAEVYLDLWMAGDLTAASPAQQALATLRRFARTFRTARPRAWLYEGLAAHHAGRERHAVAAWSRSLKAAERLAMPYEQGRAHYELGRHLPRDLPGRQAHLSRAGALFAEIGAAYELRRVQLAAGTG
jgi:class 3 adenylate cyclase/tetratricopeptide (TPR) repeat protein